MIPRYLVSHLVHRHHNLLVPTPGRVELVHRGTGERRAIASSTWDAVGGAARRPASEADLAATLDPGLVRDLIAARFLVEPARDFWADYPHPTPAQTWARQVLTDGLWMYPSWLDFPIMQCPADLAWMQALLVEERPAVVVETGLYQGGGAIFLASILEHVGAGQVISIELRPDPAVRERIAAHPLGKRITIVEGSSVDPAVVAHARRLVDGRAPVTVILDSDHGTDHVSAELAAWSPLVDAAGKLVIMDTSLAFLPEHAASNPHLAARAFLAAHADGWRISLRAGSPLVTLAEDGILERLP